MISELKEILVKEAQAILNIPLDDSYEKAIRLILEQVYHKKGKLVTGGMGKAGQIASNIATKFSSTGISACFLHPSEAQHGDLGILGKNDVMLLISNSGKTREIVELVELTRRLDPEIKFIVITGCPESPLAEEADVCLFTGNPEEVCALGLTPTTSTTVMSVIGDLLVVGTMKWTGFSAADYAKRHHGGYLGQISRNRIKKTMMENKELLIQRIRSVLEEKKIGYDETDFFGQLVFRVNGKYCIAVSDDRLEVRIDPSLVPGLTEAGRASVPSFPEKQMRGFVEVNPCDPEGETLNYWIDLALEYNATLPDE
jgi:Predicted sugar phosphate isomerase involved in capsule formation